MLFSKGRVLRLEEGGTVLGLFPNPAYDQGTVQLEPGDTIVVFSDGVSEALDVAGNEYGDDRLREAVASVLDQSPQDVLDALLVAVKGFTGEAAQNDDITALVVRYAAPAEA
jgi:sigma-B regulation protein RsbU (phosphoserine phosphatase)